MLKPIVLIKDQGSSGKKKKKKVIISGLQLLTDISLGISVGEALFNFRQTKVKRENCPFIVTFAVDIASIETFKQGEMRSAG